MTKAKSIKKGVPSPEAAQNAKAPRNPKPTRLAQLEGLLTRKDGASIAEMMEATGWQAHSVRGAMAGTLKKRRLTITSEKIEGVRHYYASAPSQ